MHCAKTGFGAWRLIADCVDGLELREEKRERPDDCFRRPKTSDDLTDYIVAIVIR